MFKRALLIGIDEYEGMPKLRGCVADVYALQPLLEKNYDNSPNFKCDLHTVPSGYVGRQQMLESLDRLLRPGADVALLYFAGHGAPERNDVVLVAQDGGPVDRGVAMSQVIGAIQDSKVPEVIVMLDCCFSGSAGRVPQIGGNVSTIREGVTILTASRGDQTAAESLGRGVFSANVCAALEGGAADVIGEVNVAGVYGFLSASADAFDQRPTFKANVDRLHVLRHCPPTVPLDELRQLRKIFTAADASLPLDPTYEDTHPSRIEANVKTMRILQNYRSAALVVPIREEHLYYAAVRSTGCRLTPLGQHFWHRADKF